MYDKEENEVTLEFVFIASVASTKYEVLMDKIQEILLQTPFLVSVLVSKGGFGIRNVDPFSIYVNCRCHRLALCFKHLFDQLPSVESIYRLLLGLRKGFCNSGKTVTF